MRRRTLLRRMERSARRTPLSLARTGLYSTRAGSMIIGKRKVLSEANLSEMITPGPGQMFGIVKNLLGYDRVLVECADGVERVCRIRGKMKRRVWIKMGDTVLVAPWDFQTSRGDILFRYTQGQVENLRRSGQLKV